MPREPRDKPGTLRRARYNLEYAFVRSLSAAVGVLPEPLAVRTGCSLGRLFWLAGSARRRIARENIKNAMPGQHTPAQLRSLVRNVFVHIGLTAVETLWMRPRLTPGNVLPRFPVDGLDALERERARGSGIIAFTPHLGNWELFGCAIAARFGRFHALARPANNPLVERYTTRLRQQMGMSVLSTRDGVRPMIAALRNGDTLAVLIDQHVHRAFVHTTFFGRPAATTAVVASLALRLNLPCFLAYSLRNGRSFRHHGYVEGPIPLVRTGSHDTDVQANTQLFNDKLEAIIRRHPEQWLWTHRRWKLADRPAAHEPDQPPHEPEHPKEASPDARPND